MRDGLCEAVFRLSFCCFVFVFAGIAEGGAREAGERVQSSLSGRVGTIKAK